MALDRWDPFHDVWSLRDAMDRLFQDNFIRPTSALLTGSRGYLPIDVIESDNSFTVHATLPGVKPEDIQITVAGDAVTIRGESRSEEEPQPGQSWVVRERRSASVYRSVTLPSPVNSDRAEARYEHGVVTLTLPKSEEARPKQIRINTSAAPVVASGTNVRTDTGVGSGAASGQQPESQANTSQSPPPSTSPKAGDQRGHDAINQASADSFPASDPPSYNPHSV
jgi:HSP20 family protein